MTAAEPQTIEAVPYRPKYVVCIDVDGTLIDENDNPIEPFVSILLAITTAEIENSGQIQWVIWSGGGKNYAEHWADKLGFHDRVVGRAKDRMILVNKGGNMQMCKPDLIIDDLDYDLDNLHNGVLLKVERKG